MIYVPRSMRQFANAAMIAASMWTVAAGSITSASAYESVVAATLAADARAAEAAALEVARAASSADALPVPGTAQVALQASLQASPINEPAQPVASDIASKAMLNANAAVPVTPRRRAVAANERRIPVTRASLNCSGEWCGRRIVLMLGIAY